MDLIDPIRDPRWAHLILRHPKGSVFHTPAWLAALEQTYGYRAIALTSTVGGAEIDDGIPFCEVKSWIGGSRLVSLPFSDHCQPLLQKPADWANYISHLSAEFRHSAWKSVELRPLEAPSSVIRPQSRLAKAGDRRPIGESDRQAKFSNHQEYNLHKIDLRSDLSDIFRNFHKDCVQRKIRRAEREGLQCKVGRSDSHLEKFYSLLLLTRRRHGLPPQPAAWFRNLRDFFGENLTIRIAAKDGRPIASVLTLLHKKTLVYKYGASDSSFHKLGAMPMLFWQAISDAKQHGIEEFDLGRSGVDSPGLNAFKEHLGAMPSRVVYLRYNGKSDPSLQLTEARASVQITKFIFSRLPLAFGRMAGALLYKHIG